jgi:DNA (cytosine-5)-methyltransferase 1
MYRPTAKGYFSGGGLMDIGVAQAGVEIIQSLDIDAQATRVMERNKSHFPSSHRIVTADITQITVFDQPRADIHYFTWPCTKYSTIADIHSARTGDELYLHGLRHLALEQPEMFWAENVPGMRKFPVVMEAITKLPGYYITVLCPVNASIWLPQNRKRLIVIGTKRNFFITPPTELIHKPRLKDILETDPEYAMPDYVFDRVNGKYRDKPIMVDPDIPGSIAPTCVAHYAKDLSTRLVKDKLSKHGFRPFTVKEWARLQGVPDDYNFETTSRVAYKIIGNGVPVPMGRWLGELAIKYFN